MSIIRAATITLVGLASTVSCLEPDSSSDSQGAALFEHMTVGRIANDGGASRGVAWADFDSDGDPDLAVANTAGQWNALYRNTPGEPARRFTKLSDPDVSTWGLFAAAGGASQGVSWVDYDGDGDVDLHVANRDDQPGFLFRNDGTDFHRVDASPLLDAVGTSMACWADVDRDGWLDVFVTGYGESPNRFFTNRGGVFTERVDHPLHFGHGTARACAWGDPNDDGLPDLYVGNAREPNQFFWNRGELTFEEVTGADHLVGHVGYTYGLSWADFDEDGDQDLFVANFDRRNVLYRNDGAGVLEPVEGDVVAEDEGGASKGHAWGDYDLDGDIDLFVANGTYGPDMRNFIYLNEGNGRFERYLGSAAAMHADTSAGAAWADFDLDGDLDVFVANWGSRDQPNRLYRNTTSETSDRSWIIMELRSSSPNRNGWGAKVRAKALIDGQSRWMTRWHIPTTGYASQNEHVVHFGLGDAASVDSLIINWPSGETDTYTGLLARQRWIASEGAGIVERTSPNN